MNETVEAHVCSSRAPPAFKYDLKRTRPETGCGGRVLTVNERENDSPLSKEPFPVHALSTAAILGQKPAFPFCTFLLFLLV